MCVILILVKTDVNTLGNSFPSGYVAVLIAYYNKWKARE